MDITIKVEVNNTDTPYEKLVRVDNVESHNPKVVSITIGTYDKYVNIDGFLCGDGENDTFSFTITPYIFGVDGEELEGDDLINHPNYYQVKMIVDSKDLPFKSMIPIIDAIKFQYQLLFIDSDTYWGKGATPIKFNVNSRFTKVNSRFTKQP